ncbi:MAG: ATP phosphoribosyltransferase [Lachnospiraceae bacterium]|nr:ATP phosphoribosyltransferase [Lachnospiraceae bacterium]
MEINESVLQRSELYVFALRELYLKHGFAPYRMSKFEEYDLYAGNKDFLVSDNVITFTDTDGKLMALKPDVTLSLIKNSKDEPDEVRKVFYNENVYRVSKGSNSFREIMQAGVECFGAIGTAEISEVVRLAAESLRTFSEYSVLAISNLDILHALITDLTAKREEQTLLYQAVSEKNPGGIRALGLDEEKTQKLIDLITWHGTVKEALPMIGKWTGEGASDDFRIVLEELAACELADRIVIDFSVTDDINYYNGIVFKGFIRDIPVPVLSGGQYDNLMKKMHRTSRAIGFAVYTDELDYLDPNEAKPDGQERFINVALPKGRLGENVYALFAKAGYECPEILEENRKLIFENPEKQIRYFWVKPSDVAIYVERGAADIGVAGKDILLEYGPDVNELLDLNTGKCRMAVAALKGYQEDTNRALRVATKFTNIARDFYQSKGRDIDIIHLNGSIELAPILGLSDIIVDIVETGTTLKENNLEVVEEIAPISARLIANKSSYKFKNAYIGKLVNGLSEVLKEENQ